MRTILSGLFVTFLLVTSASVSQADKDFRSWSQGNTHATHRTLREEGQRVGWQRTFSRGPAIPAKTYGVYRGRAFKGIAISTDDSSVEVRTYYKGRTQQETQHIVHGNAQGLIRILQEKGLMKPVK